MGQLLAYPPVLTCASPRMCRNRVIPLLPLCENQKRSGTCSKRGQRTNSWSSKPMCPTPTTSNALLRTADIRFCHIDVVYNNGGFCVMGELESIPQAEARKRRDRDLSFPAHEGVVSTLTAEIDPKWNIKVRLFPYFKATVNLTLLKYCAFRTWATSSESMG